MLDLAETYQDSAPASPLVFVLSPGVDPTDNLRKLAQVRERERMCACHVTALIKLVQAGFFQQIAHPTLVHIHTHSIHTNTNTQTTHAQERGMTNNFFSVALGQGQAQLATR